MSHLRLVQAVQPLATIPTPALQAARDHAVRFNLVSAQAISAAVNLAVSDALFQSLRHGERLEFTHELIAQNGSDQREPAYRFFVAGCAANAIERDALSHRLRDALYSGCVPMQLVNADTEAVALPWRHAWHVLPAPAVMRDRPGMEKLTMFDFDRPDEFEVGHWAEFPNWAFTQLTERLRLPSQVRVKMGVHPYRADAAQGANLARLRHRLLANSLVAFQHTVPSAGGERRVEASPFSNCLTSRSLCCATLTKSA
jgi:hypothetical protein